MTSRSRPPNPRRWPTHGLPVQWHRVRQDGHRSQSSRCRGTWRASGGAGVAGVDGPVLSERRLGKQCDRDTLMSCSDSRRPEHCHRGMPSFAARQRALKPMGELEKKQLAAARAVADAVLEGYLLSLPRLIGQEPGAVAVGVVRAATMASVRNSPCARSACWTSPKPGRGQCGRACAVPAVSCRASTWAAADSNPLMNSPSAGDLDPLARGRRAIGLLCRHRRRRVAFGRGGALRIDIPGGEDIELLDDRGGIWAAAGANPFPAHRPPSGQPPTPGGLRPDRSRRRTRERHQMGRIRAVRTVPATLPHARPSSGHACYWRRDFGAGSSCRSPKRRLERPPAVRIVDAGGFSLDRPAVGTSSSRRRSSLPTRRSRGRLPGNLYDSTEIDEILTLRIVALDTRRTDRPRH